MHFFSFPPELWHSPPWSSQALNPSLRGVQVLHTPTIVTTSSGLWWTLATPPRPRSSAVSTVVVPLATMSDLPRAPFLQTVLIPSGYNITAITAVTATFAAGAKVKREECQKQRHLNFVACFTPPASGISSPCS